MSRRSRSIRLTDAVRPWAIYLGCAGAAACATLPQPAPTPGSLGMNGAETYRHYLMTQPQQLKLRHQVESRFGDRSEVIDGFLIIMRPAHFWVRATTPLGGTLFDVRATGPADLTVETRLAESLGQAGPHFLARDLRRIYLRDCALHSHLVPHPQGFLVECDLAAGEPAIVVAAGPDLPDDHLRMVISSAGLVLQKSFSRQGRLTARVDYLDYRAVDGALLAHRIQLHHQQVPYALTIVLLGADPHFDAARVFAEAPAVAPTTPP